MMRAVLLGLFGALAAWSVSAQTYTMAQLDQRAGRWTVFITVDLQSQTTGRVAQETASGFLLNSLGYVATAQHVISLERKICPPPDKCLRTISGRIGSTVELPITLEVMDEQLTADFALLRFVGMPAGIVPLGLPLGDPLGFQQGQPLVAIGYPLNLGRMPKQGALLMKNGPAGRWITDLPLNHGDSGGPVLGLDGRVVGLVGGGYEETVNLKYVLPIYLLSINPMLVERGHVNSCEKSADEMIRAAKEDDLAMVSCQVAAGLGVNAIIYPPNEETALHLAVDRCNTRVVDYLLAQGASAFIPNKWNTPLEIATKRCGPNHRVTIQIRNLTQPAPAATASIAIDQARSVGRAFPSNALIPNMKMVVGF